MDSKLNGLLGRGGNLRKWVRGSKSLRKCPWRKCFVCSCVLSFCFSTVTRWPNLLYLHDPCQHGDLSGPQHRRRVNKRIAHWAVTSGIVEQSISLFLSFMSDLIQVFCHRDGNLTKAGPEFILCLSPLLGWDSWQHRVSFCEVTSASSQGSHWNTFNSRTSKRTRSLLL